MNSKKLDINKATVEEFANLEGIGRAKAAAIIKMRKKLGRFGGICDLQKVPGVGPGLVDRHHSVLACNPSSSSGDVYRSKSRSSVQRVTRSLTVGKEKPSKPSPADSSSRRLSRSYHFTRSHDLPLLLLGAEGGRDQSGPAKRGSPKRRRVDDVKTTANAAGLNTRRTAARGRRNKERSVVQSSLAEIAATTAQPCSGREDNSLGSSNADGGSSSDNVGPSDDGLRPANDDDEVVVGTTRYRASTFGLYNLPDYFLDLKRHSSAAASLDDVATENVDDDGRGSPSRTGVVGGDGNDDPTKCCACSTRARGASDLLYAELTSSSSSTAPNAIPSVVLALSDDGRGKSLTKRKAEEDSDENQEIKKRCCLSSDYMIVMPVSSGTNDSNQMSLRKQKIPSKKNPPPELTAWLRIFQSWHPTWKLLALDSLMDSCDPTQVRHVMQVIEPQFQRDFISLLPKELALYVLSFLDPKDLLRAAQTCRYWHMLAEDNILWREKCQEELISENLVFSNNVRRKRIGGKSPWKHLYLRQQQIEYNWRTSNRPPKVLKGHDDHVITCLEFNGTKIVSGSDDNTLKVWSAVTGKCLRTLTGHTGGVWSSQMSGNTIISGSTDRTLKVWDAETGRTVFTLYGHTSTVRCMHLYRDRVVSGSRDATLRMWDIETGHCLHVLIGHMAAVRCVQYDGRRVVSGAYDYMVKIWDPEKETCLQTLAGHTNRVYSLQFDGVHIVSGSLDTSIRVWSSETGACLHTLVGHQSLTSGMELKDNILVSGNADSTVKVWNIQTGQCLQTLHGPNKHQSAVTCLQFNRKLIITSSDDGTIKIWDLKTGDFVRNLVTLESGGSGGVVWRIRCNNSKLVCAVGSRNGTEETKLLILDFDVDDENAGASVNNKAPAAPSITSSS